MFWQRRRATVVSRLLALFGALALMHLSAPLFAQEAGPASQSPPNVSTAESAQSSQAGQKQQTVPQGGASVSPQDLSNQVNNPAAPVTFIQFRDILIPSVAGTNGPINALEMQPVVPIGPFHSFPYTQLMKITLPMFISTPGVAPPMACIGCPPLSTSASGMGDLQLFDLLSIKQSWGRWGIGPTVIFPTATETQLGAGKWQAGPSVAIIYTGIKNLTAGFVLQNPISYAGSPNRPDVNQMVITPTFTFNLAKGWFVGLSDYNFTWNWESGGAATIPLGMQVGKVVRLGRQPVSMSIEAGGAAARPDGTRNPGLILGFEVSPIFNFHLGPGERIKVRGKEAGNSR
jgi:hypothetical protein